MDGWERSKRPKQSHRVEEESANRTQIHEEESQVGNPAFLSEARVALSDQRKLWGIATPDRPRETRGSGCISITEVVVSPSQSKT
jgi:hypothetical protein